VRVRLDEAGNVELAILHFVRLAQQHVVLERALVLGRRRRAAVVVLVVLVVLLLLQRKETEEGGKSDSGARESKECGALARFFLGRTSSSPSPSLSPSPSSKYFHSMPGPGDVPAGRLQQSITLVTFSRFLVYTSGLPAASTTVWPK
jgi:hypothetical protein